ncbi:unnamed protein product [Spirodela intermedia]|uniref:WRKY domain-containing protein n=1 Tax=Spirodela intermedia TaxID=51605 RepID=A0A7I8KGL6_SPIIN|nr:unnamed protein product [Spirodela intermedia]
MWSFDPASAGTFKMEAKSGGVDNDDGGGGAGRITGAEPGGDWKTPSPPPPPPPPPLLLPSPARNNSMSIAERRAARGGFSPPRINTPRFRCGGSPLRSPAAVRSPFLTIPPGLSPTALLDSPVMLMSSQAPPSPTTGSLALSPHNLDSMAGTPLKLHEEEGGGDQEGFQSFSAVGCCQNLSSSPETLAELEEFMKTGDRSLLPRGREQGEGLPPAERPSDDSFNWRKYGQKQVKGSEYPRSYYKCTHPNCPVKKKVERSHDGRITEIIYKGKHNHPKAQPPRRTTTPDEPRSSYVKSEGESVSVLTDLSDPSSAAIERHLGELESSDALELSSPLGGGEDDDRAAEEEGRAAALEGDDGDDEPDCRRRESESFLMEGGPASRGIREPRVVVQTESEVDILDDGYRWRKYGQKVVKGNPNPRSYYKCTNPGCSVRKHVERAAHDLKSVITTYEGKHNHEVPISRSSSQSSSGGGGGAPPPSGGPGATISAESSIYGELPNTHLFKRKLALPSEFPTYLGGTSSCYPIRPLPPAELHRMAAISNFGREFPISFPMDIHRAPNVEASHGSTAGEERLFKLPKKEQEDDGVFGSDHVARRFPLE